MRRIAPFAVAGLLALTGCGGSSESGTASFKREFSAQRVQLVALGHDVGRAVQGAEDQTDAVLMSEFQSLASRATTLAGTLSQLHAPHPYQAALATLQSSVTQVASALHAIEAAAAAHDSAAAKAAAETLVADAGEVKSSDEALSAKLGLPASS